MFEFRKKNKIIKSAKEKNFVNKIKSDFLDNKK